MIEPGLVKTTWKLHKKVAWLLTLFLATESWNPPEEDGQDPGDGEHDVWPVQGPLVVGEREADRLLEKNRNKGSFGPNAKQGSFCSDFRDRIRNHCMELLLTIVSNFIMSPNFPLQKVSKQNYIKVNKIQALKPIWSCGDKQLQFGEQFPRWLSPKWNWKRAYALRLGHTMILIKAVYGDTKRCLLLPRAR